MSTEKVSTLILEVDLQCEKCYKKIQKVLCKLQPKENITKIDYDNKKNTVTISGPFDPQKLSKKLRCKACDVIKDIKTPEPKKPEEKKPEQKKPEDKKPEVKKPEEKKPEEKKPEKKPEEKKPEKKPEEKKPAVEDKKPKEDTKPTAAAATPPWSSTTTVNLQFMNMCTICYPWPCSDPAGHCHWGVQPQQPQPQPVQPQPQSQPPQPQWPSCDGMVPKPCHQPPPWSLCGGPSYCGGCGSCRGIHGWPVVLAPPQPRCCPGPSACRGCNGCKIVHESKFSYEEYPNSACAIM